MTFPDTITLEVTEEDIQFGCVGSFNNCPLARALHRAIGNPMLIPSVNAETLTLWDGYITRARYGHSKESREFIHNFDYNRCPVKPFTTTIYQYSEPPWYPILTNP
jgi:hypothetical protein